MNAWAKLVLAMYGDGASVLTPDNVKTMLGKYNAMFDDFS